MENQSRPTHVIVFDGVCNFCSAYVRFVVRRDRSRRFRFAPLQSVTGAGLLRLHGLDPADVNTFLLVKNDRAYTRSDAVIEVSKDLDGCWKAGRFLAVIPRPFRDRLYDFLARNRYRLFGRKDVCVVPTEDMADRFLD